MCVGVCLWWRNLSLAAKTDNESDTCRRGRQQLRRDARYCLPLHSVILLANLFENFANVFLCITVINIVSIRRYINNREYLDLCSRFFILLRVCWCSYVFTSSYALQYARRTRTHTKSQYVVVHVVGSVYVAIHVFQQITESDARRSRAAILWVAGSNAFVNDQREHLPKDSPILDPHVAILLVVRISRTASLL